MAFDNCFAESEVIGFEKRYQSLLHAIPRKHAFVVSVYLFLFVVVLFLCCLLWLCCELFWGTHIPVFRVKCAGKYLLFHFLEHIMKDEGEGVILREPRSIYFRGRSPSLIKLKVFTFPPSFYFILFYFLA
jgi:hypothetical protein